MSRMPLSSRRPGTTQGVRIAGKSVHLTVGFRDEEKTQVGEIFLVLSKTGAQERALFDEIARSASHRLQLGEPLEELADGWLNTKMRPRGIVTGDDRIKMCQGPLDWAARHLLINYCGREDLAHVKKEAL